MKQLFAISCLGVLLLTVLLLFGKIDAPKKPAVPGSPLASAFNPNEFIVAAKQKLTPAQLVYVSDLENSISRGNVKKQTLESFTNLADFWKDSVKAFVPYAYYQAEAAKLDNSEKSLTFAAQLFLDNLRSEEISAIKSWEAETAVDLFKRALEFDPENDALKIGLGSCYVFGKGMIGDASETMKGIQQLLQVVKKDSGNLKAQLVLGIGGVISRQYPKAIERLLKVVTVEPGNLEAVSWLADAYAANSDTENAVKWYQYSKKLVNNVEYSKEVDERIKALNTTPL